MAGRKTQQLLSICFQRDAHVLQFKCFQAWTRHTEVFALKRSAEQMAKVSIETWKCMRVVRGWHCLRQRQIQYETLIGRATEFYHDHCIAHAFEAWLKFHWQKLKRQHQRQHAETHANRQRLRHRLDRWIAFSYGQTQNKIAGHFHRRAQEMRCFEAWYGDAYVRTTRRA